jgi:hypothetical protein
MCRNRRRDGDNRNMKIVSVYISFNGGNRIRGHFARDKEIIRDGEASSFESFHAGRLEAVDGGRLIRSRGDRTMFALFVRVCTTKR